MSRGLDPANETAISQNAVAPVLFVDLDFPSGHLRMHSAIGTITWGGYDWLGAGTFGDVDGLTENAELERKTVTYTLRGVPNDLIASSLGESWKGRPDKVYIAFSSTTTYQMIAEPALIHSGKMDVAKSKTGKTSTLTITSESRIASWRRPVVRRYTDAEQQRRFPGDRGLEFLSQASQKEIVWGRKE